MEYSQSFHDELRLMNYLDGLSTRKNRNEDTWYRILLFDFIRLWLMSYFLIKEFQSAENFSMPLSVKS